MLEILQLVRLVVMEVFQLNSELVLVSYAAQENSLKILKLIVKLVPKDFFLQFLVQIDVKNVNLEVTVIRVVRHFVWIVDREVFQLKNQVRVA